MNNDELPLELQANYLPELNLRMKNTNEMRSINPYFFGSTGIVLSVESLPNDRGELWRSKQE